MTRPATADLVGLKVKSLSVLVTKDPPASDFRHILNANNNILVSYCACAVVLLRLEGCNVLIESIIKYSFG